jgi:protein gp37
MEKRFHKGVEGHIVIHPERLDIPLKRKKPTVYAIWNDLFHEAVNPYFIKSVFDMVSKTVGLHVFLILTKRPKQMYSFTKWMAGSDDISIAEWPRNVYLGLTVCNQEEADEKIPVFLQVPGRKFLSIEPMLGKIDFRCPSSLCEDYASCSGPCNEAFKRPRAFLLSKFDAVLLGAETGPGARPLHPDWVRKVRDDCAAAGVNFFFKQWGEFRPPITEQEKHKFKNGKGYGGALSLSGAFEDRGHGLIKTGKKNAGRTLDGVTHDALPWAQGKEQGRASSSVMRRRTNATANTHSRMSR